MAARLVHQNRIHLVQRVDPPLPPQKKIVSFAPLIRPQVQYQYQSKGMPSEETVVFLTTVCI